MSHSQTSITNRKTLIHTLFDFMTSRVFSPEMEREMTSWEEVVWTSDTSILYPSTSPLRKKVTLSHHGYCFLAPIDTRITGSIPAQGKKWVDYSVLSILVEVARHSNASLKVPVPGTPYHLAQVPQSPPPQTFKLCVCEKFRITILNNNSVWKSVCSTSVIRRMPKFL